MPSSGAPRLRSDDASAGGARAGSTRPGPAGGARLRRRRRRSARGASSTAGAASGAAGRGTTAKRRRRDPERRRLGPLSGRLYLLSTMALVVSTPSDGDGGPAASVRRTDARNPWCGRYMTD